ncbi:hypothetical protein IJI31_01100 [bacterium]|nr:hypothetical protein [bacterium]
MNLIKFIKNKIKERQIYKENVVLEEWTYFFEKRHRHLKYVELPPHRLAEEQLAYIKAANLINFYYKKIMSARKKSLQNFFTNMAAI